VSDYDLEDPPYEEDLQVSEEELEDILEDIRKNNTCLRDLSLKEL